MNTYKINAISGRTLKLRFTVDAPDLLLAQGEAMKKLKREGYKYALIDTITELGPSKESSPAKTPCICTDTLTCAFHANLARQDFGLREGSTAAPRRLETYTGQR